MRLIDKYKLSDYCDSVFKRIKPAETLSPDYIFEEMQKDLVKMLE